MSKLKIPDALVKELQEALTHEGFYVGDIADDLLQPNVIQDLMTKITDSLVKYQEKAIERVALRCLHAMVEDVKFWFDCNGEGVPELHFSLWDDHSADIELGLESFDMLDHANWETEDDWKACDQALETLKDWIQHWIDHNEQYREAQ